MFNSLLSLNTLKKLLSGVSISEYIIYLLLYLHSFFNVNVKDHLGSDAVICLYLISFLSFTYYILFYVIFVACIKHACIHPKNFYFYILKFPNNIVIGL